MKRRLLSVILTLAMLLSLLPTVAVTAVADGDVIEISDAAGLAAFRDSVNAGNDYAGKTVTLTKDIDLGGRAWKPIGTGVYEYSEGGDDWPMRDPVLKSIPFAGIFDGGGHTITGLYFDESAGNFVGLFGYSSGTIKNLGVDVANAVITVAAAYKDYAGGVVGYSESGRVENCYSTGNFSVNVENPSGNTNIQDAYIGGVVGCIDSCAVESCYNTGNVSVNIKALGNDFYIGGVVGGTGETVEMKSCYNTGKVEVISGGDGTVNVGGVIGHTYSGYSSTVTGCYNTGEVSGTGKNVNAGGVVGQNGTTACTVTGCYYLEGTADKGIGNDGNDTEGQAEGISAEDFKNLAAKLGDGWEDDPVLGRPVLTANSEGAAGSEEAPYVITNLTELENFRDYVNAGNTGEGKYFTLVADIDMSSTYSSTTGTSWMPIGNDESHAFTGTFDGDGHKITGLYINNSSANQGLFGYVGSGGTVENVGVSGEVTTTGSSAGGIAGYSSGTVQNCYNTANIKALRNVGGIVGWNTGKVQNCYNTGDITDTEIYWMEPPAGGIVGQHDNPGVIQNCYSTGNISATSGRNGGIAGINNHATVQDCYWTGSAKDGLGYYHDPCTTTNVNQVNSAQLASGEVAWLLQGSQSDQVWGQMVGSGYPELTDDSSKAVYRVTFDYDDGEAEDVYRYVNNGGTVTEPTGPVAPDGEGEWAIGWYADDGTRWDFDANTVTGDIILTARWTRVYAITVEEAENGTVTASLDKAAKDETVTLTVKPDNGYQLKALTVTAQDGTSVTVADDNTFVMPASDVTVRAEFEKKTEAGGDNTPAPTPSKPSGPGSSTPGPGSSTPGPGSSSSANSVTVSNPDAANGTVRSDVSSAKAGDTVTVSSEADSGYISAAPVVTDKYGNSVPVTENADGTYSFTMPEGGVTVTGSYVTPGQLFSDVSDSAWYRNGLAYVVENNLMTGYGKGIFAPGDELSRAMLAQILYNTEDRPGVDGGGSFADVPSGTWYIDAVTWAAANGIVAGYGNGLYGPEDPITREQLAVMLWRYAGSPSSGADMSTFTDAGAVSGWAADAMAWAVENGIIKGKGNGVLDPKGKATRAEAASMLMRFLSR